MKTQAAHTRMQSSALELLQRAFYPRDARALRSWMRVSQGILAEILGAGRRTVARWERTRAAPQAESSEGRLLFALAQVKGLLLLRYGDADEARRWLKTPLPAFGGKRPEDILRAKGPIPVLDLLKADLFGPIPSLTRSNGRRPSGGKAGMRHRDPKLAEIVRRLVQAYRPECIYLFGSVARGEAGPDSDYDLLLVVPDDAPPKRKRSRLAYEILRGMGTAADVLVCTHSYFEARRHLRASLPGTVLREGWLLHAA